MEELQGVDTFPLEKTVHGILGKSDAFGNILNTFQ
jgi:hypothetical protein